MSEQMETIRAAVLRRRNIAKELRERGDEASIIAADELDRLHALTANELSWTHEPTQERVRLFSPWRSSFKIAGEFPHVLKALTAIDNGDFEEVDF